MFDAVSIAGPLCEQRDFSVKERTSDAENCLEIITARKNKNNEGAAVVLVARFFKKNLRRVKTKKKKS